MALVNLFGNIHRIVRGSRLAARTITTIYGAVELDLTQLCLEPGDYYLRVVNICGSVKLRVPEQIGVELDATAVWSELKIEATADGEQALEHTWLSEGFDRAAVRVYLTFHGVLAGLSIERVPVRDVGVDAQPIDAPAVPAYRLPPYQGETRKLGRLK